jgi:hypothetical protein
MLKLTKEEAIKRATEPDKLIDEEEINEILMWMNGHISELQSDEWEKQLICSQHKVKLLREVKPTTLADAEWRISVPYIDWMIAQNLRRKYTAYRQDLRSRQEMFMKTSKYIRNNPQ